MCGWTLPGWSRRKNLCRLFYIAGNKPYGKAPAGRLFLPHFLPLFPQVLRFFVNLISNSPMVLFIIPDKYVIPVSVSGAFQDLTKVGTTARPSASIAKMTHKVVFFVEIQRKRAKIENIPQAISKKVIFQ